MEYLYKGPDSWFRIYPTKRGITRYVARKVSGKVIWVWQDFLRVDLNQVKAAYPVHMYDREQHNPIIVREL